MLGKMSASTTASAKSTECLAICASALHTCNVGPRVKQFTKQAHVFGGVLLGWGRGGSESYGHYGS
jgi:hypothetical protein